MAYLIAKTGVPQDGIKDAEITLGNEGIIGRDKDNSIFIDDQHLSRQHAKIIKEKDGFYHLVDLGSRNGTFVNDEKIFRKRLKNKDRIKVGKTILIFNEEAQEKTNIQTPIASVRSEGENPLKGQDSQPVQKKSKIQAIDPDEYLKTVKEVENKTRQNGMKVYLSGEKTVVKKESGWGKFLFYLAIIVFFITILLWAKWATEKWLGKLEEKRIKKNNAIEITPE